MVATACASKECSRRSRGRATLLRLRPGLLAFHAPRLASHCFEVREPRLLESLGLRLLIDHRRARSPPPPLLPCRHRETRRRAGQWSRGRGHRTLLGTGCRVGARARDWRRDRLPLATPPRQQQEQEEARNPTADHEPGGSASDRRLVPGPEDVRQASGRCPYGVVESRWNHPARRHI